MKKIARFTAFALAMALVFCTLTGCGVTEQEPDPLELDESYTSVVLEYFRLLADGEYEQMYTMLDPASNARASDKFIERHTNIYNGIGMVNLEIAITDVETIAFEYEQDPRLGGRVVYYSASMDTVAGPLRFENSVTVYARQDGEEAVRFAPVWDHDQIFPGLREEYVVRVSTTAAVRGSIYDRSGLALAHNGDVYEVGFVPGRMDEDRQPAVEAAAALLGITVEGVEARLNASWVRDDYFVPVKRIKMGDERVDALLAIQGIQINTVTDRVYPLGEAAAHLTGYVQAVTAEDLENHPGENYSANSVIGRTGLEALLEESLRAIDGCAITIQDTDGNIIKDLVNRPVRNGQSVYLTIDAGTQQLTYEQLKNDKGAAVVMEPDSGRLLALVSTPAYDPNDFALGMTDEQWASYRDDEAMPMYNRFKASLVPGSSIKPIIGAIGLDSGAFTAEEDFGAAGRSWQKDESWGSYTVTTLIDSGSAVALENAMRNSDNIYFSKAALKIGGDTLAKELLRLGFGEQLPFPFGITASSFGEENRFTEEIDLATSGHGQGRMLVNPLHMASMYSALYTGGDMMAPLLGREDDAEVWIANAFTADTTQEIQNAMLGVVHNPAGNAYGMAPEGLTIAGKTGTAEIKNSKEDTSGTETGWFCGYTVGSENPVLVVCVVEDVKNRGGSGYVLPIASALFEHYA